MSEKIKPEELRIDKLESKYRELLNNFTTSTKELKDFLIQDALNNQNQRLSVTFLWFYGNSLVGYVTLLTDKINLEGNLKEFFRENDIHYKSLPALKIGRLCVDENFLRRGIGKLMVMFSIQKSNEINEISKRKGEGNNTDVSGSKASLRAIKFYFRCFVYQINPVLGRPLFLVNYFPDKIYCVNPF